jgi:Tfp pilus assembly protein PilV
MTMGGRLRGEDGFTLSEALAALIILGVAVTAIVTAMGVGVVSSDRHRAGVTADALLRSYAERLQATQYLDCATPPSGAGPHYPSATALLGTLPTGFADNDVRITAVAYWDGNNAPASYGADCTLAAPDRGAQLITLQAAAGKRGRQTTQIVKREP